MYIVDRNSGTVQLGGGVVGYRGAHGEVWCACPLRECRVRPTRCEDGGEAGWFKWLYKQLMYISNKLLDSPLPTLLLLDASEAERCWVAVREAVGF